MNGHVRNENIAMGKNRGPERNHMRENVEVAAKARCVPCRVCFSPVAPKPHSQIEKRGSSAALR